MQIDQRLKLLSIDDKDKSNEELLKCGYIGCIDKAVMYLNMPNNNAFPTCRKHLEMLYNSGFFSELTDINHLKMVEGIIKHGNFKEWIKSVQGEC